MYYLFIGIGEIALIVYAPDTGDVLCSIYHLCTYNLFIGSPDGDYLFTTYIDLLLGLLVDDIENRCGMDVITLDRCILIDIPDSK
jgi:hypothetical protein